MGEIVVVMWQVQRWNIEKRGQLQKNICIYINTLIISGGCEWLWGKEEMIQIVVGLERKCPLHYDEKRVCDDLMWKT